VCALGPRAAPALQVTVVKKEMGLVFKKEAKAAQEALESLTDCEAMELKVGLLFKFQVRSHALSRGGLEQAGATVTAGGLTSRERSKAGGV